MATVSGDLDLGLEHFYVLGLGLEKTVLALASKTNSLITRLRYSADNIG